MNALPEDETGKVAYWFQEQYKALIQRAVLDNLRKRVGQYQTFTLSDVEALKEIQEELKEGTLAEKEVLYSHLRYLVRTLKGKDLPDYAAISINEYTVLPPQKNKNNAGLKDKDEAVVPTGYTYYHALWRVKGKKTPDAVNLCKKD